MRHSPSSTSTWRVPVRENLRELIHAANRRSAEELGRRLLNAAQAANDAVDAALDAAFQPWAGTQVA
jgi:hypothetical protein